MVMNTSSDSTPTTRENENDGNSSDSHYLDTRIKISELKVEHFMTKNPVVAHSNVNLPGAIDIMTTKGIGNLVVIENEEPIGIFTEREILSYLFTHKQVPSHILLRDIDLQPFCSVSPTATVLSAAKKNDLNEV